MPPSCLTASVKEIPGWAFDAAVLRLPAALPSPAVGVGQSFRSMPFLPPSDVGVGNNPDPVAAMRGAQVGSRYAVPLRVIPDRGQVTQDDGESAASEDGDVLDNHEAGPKIANESGKMEPEAGPRACNTSVLAGLAEVLAGEAAADDIDGSVPSSKLGCVQLRDIVVAVNVGPMAGKNCPAVGVDFAEGDGAEAGALEAETEAADSAEEVEDIQSRPMGYHRSSATPAHMPATKTITYIIRSPPARPPCRTD